MQNASLLPTVRAFGPLRTTDYATPAELFTVSVPEGEMTSVSVRMQAVVTSGVDVGKVLAYEIVMTLRNRTGTIAMLPGAAIFGAPPPPPPPVGGQTPGYTIVAFMDETNSGGPPMAFVDTGTGVAKFFVQGTAACDMTWLAWTEERQNTLSP